MHTRSAIGVLRRCLEHEDGLHKFGTELAPLRSRIGVALGRCYNQLGDTELALEACWRAFVADPTRREALLDLAALHLQRKEYQHAVCYCSAALSIPRTISWMDEDPLNYQWRPHKLLCEALMALGRTKEASKQHRAAAKLVTA